MVSPEDVAGRCSKRAVNVHGHRIRKLGVSFALGVNGQASSSLLDIYYLAVCFPLLVPDYGGFSPQVRVLPEECRCIHI